MVDRDRRRYLGLCAAGAVGALAGCGAAFPSSPADEQADAEKIDDWQYTPSDNQDVLNVGGGSGAGTTDQASTAADDSLGREVTMLDQILAGAD